MESVWSATNPINKGPTTPPTGDIIKKEDARLVWLPNPFNERANMAASRNNFVNSTFS